MTNILEALRTGWTISSVTTVLAHGQNDEGRGFLVKFAEPTNHILREVYLPYSTETETLLKRASAPLAA